MDNQQTNYRQPLPAPGIHLSLDTILDELDYCLGQHFDVTSAYLADLQWTAFTDEGEDSEIQPTLLLAPGVANFDACLVPPDGSMDDHYYSNVGIMADGERLPLSSECPPDSCLDDLCLSPADLFSSASSRSPPSVSPVHEGRIGYQQTAPCNSAMVAATMTERPQSRKPPNRQANKNIDDCPPAPKKQVRRETEPKKCHLCQKSFQWRRDLERLYQQSSGDSS